MNAGFSASVLIGAQSVAKNFPHIRVHLWLKKKRRIRLATRSFAADSRWNEFT
jgi:hypothetical protein